MPPQGLYLFGDVGRGYLSSPAADTARQAWLLCLGELEIRDIADAIIVDRLFEGLLANGVVVG